MTEVPVSQRKPLEPLQVVMIVLVVASAAGGMLLLSAARPTAEVDGAVAWREGSVLRAVVELLCLNHRFPTEYAGDVKNYLLGVGAGLAAIALGLAILIRSKRSDVVSLPAAAELSTAKEVTGKAHVAPLRAAQILVLLYIAWAFASSRWARTPEHAALATGAAAWLAILFLWAMTLGVGLSRAAAVLSARALLIILLVTGVIAVWYHYGRKPMLRAEFPVGNPAFVAVCLIPGIVLALGEAQASVRALFGQSEVRSWLRLLFSIAALGVMGWAFRLADVRGAYVGLAFALLTIVFFMLRGRARLIPLVLAVLLVAFGVWYVSTHADLFSPTNRNATLRLRLYAWGYAWRMFLAKPLTGFGLGGFVLYGDAYAADDVLADPMALENRIAHAHNEWVEVLADLGSVGLVLIAGTLLLTFSAGLSGLHRASPGIEKRTLATLLGGLVGVVVAESFSVGLRVSAVPTIFATVLGLVWALSRQAQPDLAIRLASRPVLRPIVGGLAVVLGIGALALAQQDFTAARNARLAGEALATGEYEAAVERATAANGMRQLNPQRALTNLSRLGEAHVAMARYLLGRAMDRRARADGTAPPNPRLEFLAQEDFQASAEQCDRAASVLKELLVLSPGFIHHGKLAYRLNLTLAQLAAVRGESEKEAALVASAAAALEREMRRQPYDPELAAAYAGLVAGNLNTDALFDILAPPLRHRRITSSYVDVLRSISAVRDLGADLDAIETQAAMPMEVPADSPGSMEVADAWAPERLRLAAAARFLRGEYAGARRALERAAAAYAAIRESAPLGAASCFAELADCTFFDDPRNPSPAIAAADRAVELAPQSRLGRELQSAVRARMVNYQLAAGDEAKALDLLRTLAPEGATEAQLRMELGARYRRLCESLLGRREAGGVLRKAPDDLMSELRRWIARAVELSPEDAGAHLVLADLAFHGGQDVQTAGHLARAVDLGLPLEVALTFLRAARDRRPDSAALDELFQELERRMDSVLPVAPPELSAEPLPSSIPGRPERRPDDPAAPIEAPATSRKP